MSDNFREFSRRMVRFTSVIVPERGRMLVRMTANQIINGLVLRTASDTGLTRGRWQASVGSLSSNSAGGEDPVGQSTMERLRSVSDSAPFGSIIFFSNSAPQIMLLERGGYVPANPVDSPEANERRAARRNARQQRISRQMSGHPGAPFVVGGYSKKSPQGMVAVTLNEVSQQVEKIARQLAAQNPSPSGGGGGVIR